MIANELVVKSNKLIQASYRLTLTEQRIILYAIAKFRKQNKQIMANEKVVIDPHEFAELYSINPRFVYSAIKEATLDMFKREVTIYEIDQNTGKEISIQTRWIWERGHSDDLNYSHIKFSPRVIGYFHQLEKNFTSYSIESISKLNSVYAVRLYELLKQFEKVKYRDVTIVQLRKLFELKDDEYEVISNFKARVIDSSVKQINQLTDIKIAYTQIKRGRTIIGFKFSIATNKKVIKKDKLKDAVLDLDHPEQTPEVIKQVETIGKGFVNDEKIANLWDAVANAKRTSFKETPVPVNYDIPSFTEKT